MKHIKLMRIIDKYVGTIICIILSCFDILISLIKPAKSSGKTDNILIIKFWGMGSIILLSPAVKNIKRTYPQANITMLTFRANKEICIALGIFDEVLTINSGFVSLIFETLQTVLYLWKKNIDIVLNFEFFARYSSIVSYLANRNNIVEFESEFMRRGKWKKNTVRINLYYHIKDIFLKLAESIGVESYYTKPIIEKNSPEHSEKIDKLLKENNVENFIAVNINASPLAYERRLPKEKHIYIIKRLLEETDYSIVLIGSRDEKKYVDIVKEQLKDSRIFNFAGKTNIFELISLLSKSKMLITNDSGPLHIAAAIGVNTASFFGPDTSRLYGPIGDNHLIFDKKLYCSPCMTVNNNKTVVCNNNFKCLNDFDNEEIYINIKQFLNSLSLTKKGLL